MTHQGKTGGIESTAPVALLTVEDVAELLRTSPRQIRNMRARGQLPSATKVPGLGLRWAADAVYAWVAGLRGEGKSP